MHACMHKAWLSAGAFPSYWRLCSRIYIRVSGLSESLLWKGLLLFHGLELSCAFVIGCRFKGVLAAHILLVLRLDIVLEMRILEARDLDDGELPLARHRRHCRPTHAAEYFIVCDAAVSRACVCRVLALPRDAVNGKCNVECAESARQDLAVDAVANHGRWHVRLFVRDGECRLSAKTRAW